MYNKRLAKLGNSDLHYPSPITFHFVSVDFVDAFLVAEYGSNIDVTTGARASCSGNSEAEKVPSLS
jgi:heme/copper-type cytochrome/quinol oxidase subunit 2